MSLPTACLINQGNTPHDIYLRGSFPQRTELIRK